MTNNNYINPALACKSGLKAIIFDLGNVLIDFDHMIAVKRIFGFTKKKPEEIFNLFFDSQLTALFEEGKLTPLKFFLKVKEILHLKLSYHEFLPIWNEVFFLTEENRSVYNLAKALKKHYKIALLSNINILHFDYLNRNFPHLFDTSHHIITSFEVGLRKPHPLIYKKTLDMLGVVPQGVFYTDDRAELIDKACELGIRGFVFKDIEQFKKDLLSIGVKNDF